MLSAHSLLFVAVLGFLSTVAAAPQGWNSTFRINAAAMYYQLRDDYSAGNFFNSFNFFTAPDPTHGFVSYQSQQSAWDRGLINNNNNQIFMGVDHTTYNPPSPGRASVRVTSNKAYNHGLFIADIAHMPSSTCGVWPAFWMFGPNWPYSGEIDIIEGVNQATTNAMTLHTAPGCYANTAGSQGGTYLQDSNCNANTAFTGCSVSSQAPYGDSFNAQGGGVYAMQWESSGIYIWFFPRNNIPGDIRSGSPQTQNWGTPVVAFNGGGGCNIDSYFKDQNIVFDTTFCGDWAGGVWGSTSCSNLGGSCQNYVAGNPGAFANAFWSINSVKVYQLGY